MISIYDEILTKIKSNLNISSNMNRLYEEAVVIKPVSGSLLSLIIPLFNYDEVLISSDKLFNVMPDGSIIIEDYSVNPILKKIDELNKVIDEIKKCMNRFNGYTSIKINVDGNVDKRITTIRFNKKWTNEKIKNWLFDNDYPVESKNIRIWELNCH